MHTIFAIFAGIILLVAEAYGQPVIFHVDQIDQDLPDVNPGNGVCATVGGTCTLRAAIMEANAQAAVPSLYIVKLPEGANIVLSVTGDDDMAALGDLDIRKNISITARPLFQPEPVPLPPAQRATIRNGYYGFPLFAVHPDQTLWLSDLVLSQSTRAVHSKGDKNDETTVILDHVAITNNLGLFAVAVNASHVTIDDSEISGNVSTMSNQYVHCSLISARDELTMRRTRVTDNEIDGAANGLQRPWVNICAGHGPSLIEDSLLTDNVTADPEDSLSALGGYVLELQRTTVTGYSHAALVSRWGGLGGQFNRAGDYKLDNVTFSGQGQAGVALRAESDFYALRIRNSTMLDQPFDVIIEPAENYTASVFQVIGSLLTSCDLPAVITRQTDYYNISTAVTGCLVGGTNLIVPSSGLVLPLADNGGFVPTHALPPGSGALDSGPPTMGGTYGCRTTDARRQPRPADGTNNGTARCDVGAFERQGDPLFHDRFHTLP